MEDHKTTRKDHLQAVWFAAGTAVLIACVERAVVVSIFKQWHVWVFLALNLLLIAILFTSTHPPRNHSNPPPKPRTGQESDKKQPSDDVVDGGVNVLGFSEVKEVYCADEEEVEEDDDDVEDSNKNNNNNINNNNETSSSSGLLSNDELNERVEAFISRFRQQYLVSEVKIRRSGSDNVCRGAVFSKTITV